MSNNHPRFKHYPQHGDYYRMYPAYRPFVYWINEPSYRSAYVNTDDLGVRWTILPGGSVADVHALKTHFEQCDIIIGGSTVFGVDASADDKTISSYLSSDDVPCINLGNRGATSYQELLLFMFMQPKFPKIRNIHILSGVNDCSLAAMEGSLIYDGYGGIFGQDHYMTYPYMSNLSVCYDDQSYNRLRMYNAIERRYRDNGFIRSIIRAFLGKAYGNEPLRNLATDKRMSFERKLEQNLKNLSNQFSSWKALADGHGASLRYFLQPCVNWNDKAVSKVEAECYGADLKVYPSMADYANPAFHTSYSKSVKALCENAGIPFHDTNDALHSLGADIDIFTDVCHLTDSGNRVVADFIRQKSNA